MPGVHAMGMMTDHYIEQAETCALKAAETQLPEARKVFLRAEAKWRDLAAKARFGDQRRLHAGARG